MSASRMISGRRDSRSCFASARCAMSTSSIVRFAFSEGSLGLSIYAINGDYVSAQVPSAENRQERLCGPPVHVRKLHWVFACGRRSKSRSLRSLLVASCTAEESQFCGVTKEPSADFCKSPGTASRTPLQGRLSPLGNTSPRYSFNYCPCLPRPRYGTFVATSV